MEVHMNRIEAGKAALSGGDAPLPPLYDRDFALWLSEQAALLRERKFALLDVGHLAEEVDCMGSSLHRELRSRLKVILIHLLKCRFQPDHRSSSWLETLDEQRDQIAELFAQSPSLKRHAADYADRVYAASARRTARETGLPVSAFPPANPFSEAELLDPDYVP
jgi:hypothetical protein